MSNRAKTKMRARTRAALKDAKISVFGGFVCGKTARRIILAAARNRRAWLRIASLTD